MKKLFYVACLLIAHSTSAQYNGQGSSITRSSYSLKYPAGWMVDTSKMLGMDLLVRSPRTDTADNFFENMNVFVQDLHGQGYDLSRMGKESETQLKNVITDIEILESRLDTSSSLHYYSMKYKSRQGKFQLTTEQRYYLHNEVGYAFTFTAQQGKEDMYRDISEFIFGSIVF